GIRDRNVTGVQTCALPIYTEKLKSITFPKGELTDIWIEEASEILEEDFNQLDVRLRGKGAHKQMVLTFNPVSVLHWLKLRFFDKIGRASSREGGNSVVVGR